MKPLKCIEQFSNGCRKAKPQLQSQLKSQAIVIFSQPLRDRIHEVITSQWKVKVKPIVQELCNYWTIIENGLSCFHVSWITSQSKSFMSPSSGHDRENWESWTERLCDSWKPLRVSFVFSLFEDRNKINGFKGKILWPLWQFVSINLHECYGRSWVLKLYLESLLPLRFNRLINQHLLSNTPSIVWWAIFESLSLFYIFFQNIT